MSAARTTLILGASGQDGTYLARHLAQAGERVVAAGRTLAHAIPRHWAQLGVADAIERRNLDYLDGDDVAALVETARPDAIHVLSGQSSVRQSFVKPAETIVSQSQPVVSVLEAVRRGKLDTHVVFAGSTECFGRFEGLGSENRPFDVRNPYAAGKVAGALAVRAYREAFGIRASTVFLSNHESALRDERFLFGKVLAGIGRIRAGGDQKITTGDLSVVRDWGYAPEFAQTLDDISRLEHGHEVVVATGRSVLLREAVETLFEAFDLDPQHWLEEIAPPDGGQGGDRHDWDVSRLRQVLGKAPEVRFPALAERLRDDWLALHGAGRT